MSYIAQNIQAIRSCLPTDRPVRLVVVSKYASPKQIMDAYDCGIRDFGENKIQDAQAKWNDLPREMVEACQWHFLGHLQKNKIHKALAMGFTYIQSVDSVLLAEKLSQAAQAINQCQRVLLQVNLTQAPQQSGFLETDLIENFDRLSHLSGLDIEGLMTIGPVPDPDNRQAGDDIFKRLYNLRNRLRSDDLKTLPELSMGMSEDFEHALKCGATIIRIGNRVFG